jgi:hypothetical protein
MLRSWPCCPATTATSTGPLLHWRGPPAPPPPTGSYYLTGFLNEKPLTVLRGALARLGIARAAAVKEPEDQVAALCEVMAGLISGAYGAPQPLAQQPEFFRGPAAQARPIVRGFRRALTLRRLH